MNPEIERETFQFAGSPAALCCTLYRSARVETRAAMLYFHGGGLIYGQRDDLPEFHLDRLCGEGVAVFTFDYRLAPAAKLPEICADVDAAIHWYLAERERILGFSCPYFLWGRSAGAYLALLAGLRCQQEPPRGVISYYGFAFLENFWYREENPYYQKFPKLDRDTLEKQAHMGGCTSASLEERYALYVSARQTGTWIPLFFSGKEKELLRDYSFRSVADLSGYPPVLLAHSLRDPDVPFAASRAIAQRLPKAELFSSTLPRHDFDACTDAFTTADLLDRTVQFVLEDGVSHTQAG